MKLGINLARPTYHETNQFADIALCGSRVVAPKVGAKGTIGPDGWPVGADNYQQNLFLGYAATDYVFIVLTGAVLSVDVNQGADADGHPGGHIKVVPHADSTRPGIASAMFTARGAGYISVTATDPGKTSWAVVQAADLERWKLDPYCFSSSWLPRYKGFAAARFMDWLLTNTNMANGYVDPDPTRPGAFTNGVPLSIPVKFGKQTGISPWLNIPVKSDDAAIGSFGQRIQELVTAGLKPIIEIGNEVWNNSSNFPAHKYAVEQEAALIAAGKLPADASPNGAKWYGYRATQASKILQSMGWKVGRDFDMTIGCFPNGLDQAPRVLAGFAAAGGTDPDFSLWMTTFYTHGDLVGDFNKTVAIAKPRDFNAAFDTILHGKVSSVDWLAGKFAQHAAIAKAHNWKPVAYEGNMAFVAIPFFADSALVAKNAGITKADMVAFFGALAAHPRSGEVMTAVLKAMDAAGFDLACAYNDQGKGGEDGFWGLYGTPAWDAMMDYIAAQPVAPMSIDDRFAAIEKRLTAGGL